MGSTIIPLPSPTEEPAPDPVGGEFARSVRDALRHLHDPVYLQTHPLTRILLDPGDMPEIAGKRLQRLLQDTIASLRPESPARDARARRRHDLLLLRYGEGLEIDEVADKLAISRREYNREHRQALDAVVALLAGTQARLPASSPPLSTMEATLPLSPPHSVPLPLTSFVGREREIAEVLRLISVVRLVTLSGPPGAGKTRLAIQVAETLATTSTGEAPFRDGIVFVPLAPLPDARLVLSAIGTSFGIPEAANRPLLASVTGHLSQRQTLLILDNFEHVLEAAPVVSQLLEACRQLTVLVTSRAPLHLSGEHEFVMPPLAVPAPGETSSLDDVARAEAVRLYVDRARAIQAGFHLTEQNAPAVVEICRRLGGLPLAIELAAARTRVFPPYALLGRLGGGGESDARGSSLQLLTGGPRDAPARQRTLRGALDWSYRLLPIGEQRLLARLAIFAGGWSLEAAEAVAGPSAVDDLSTGSGPLPEVLDAISSLVEKNLVQQGELPDGEPRFNMLEMIREFGLEQLAASGDEEDARDAHAAYILALAERVEPGLLGPDQIALLDRLERELPNIRAALGWLRDRGQVEQGLRLSTSPGRFWWRRGYLSEGRSWLDSFLALATAEPASVVKIRALIVAGDIAAWQKDREAAQARHAEAATLARSLGDTRGLALALFGLASDAIDRGEPVAAEPLLEESGTRFGEVNDAWGVALVRGLQGTAALARGDHQRAGVCLREALAVFRERQDWRFVAAELDQLGQLALARGDLPGAQHAHGEALALSVALGDKTGIAWGLLGHAGIAGLSRQAEQAAWLLGAAGALRDALGARLAPHEQAIYAPIESAVQAALGPSAYAAALEYGVGLSQADSVAAASEVLAGKRMSTRLSASAAIDLAPPAERFGLTPREWQVLRLLSEGLSDKEIALSLYVSRRTAATHVASVFRKLGVTSRAAAAAFAVRHGLA